MFQWIGILVLLTFSLTATANFDFHDHRPYGSMGYQGLRLRTEGSANETKINTKSYHELNLEAGLQPVFRPMWGGLLGVRISLLRYQMRHTLGDEELANFRIQGTYLAIPFGVRFDISKKTNRLFALVKLVPKVQLQESQEIETCYGICSNERRTRATWWHAEGDLNFGLTDRFALGLGVAVPLSNQFKGPGNLRYSGFLASATYFW
ncbi:MAG: hypothetical protein KDD22_04305 [Bdellovibrionales bacterium]|nr:hypothetical protein [Bdellovibrionales bacterium]